MRHKRSWWRWSLAALIILTAALLPRAAQGGQKPDLTIESIELDPLPLRAGQPVTLKAVIVNSGRRAVNTRFEVRFAIDGTRISRQLISRLSARQRRTVQVEWVAVEGEHTLTVEVDRPRNAVEEANELNNVRELALSVPPDSDIQSFTQSALERQADTWERVATALLLTPSDSLFALFDALKSGFETVAKVTQLTAATLQTLTEELPAGLSEEALAPELAEGYAAISAAATTVEQGLTRLDLSTSVEAMQQIETTMRALAARASARLPLAGLEPAAEALKRAIAAALEAQARFSDASRGPVEQPLDTLFNEVGQLSQALSAVAQDLTAAAQAQAVRFLDAQGQPLRRLSAPLELTIRVPAAGFRFALVDPTGQGVLALEVEGDRLTWTGTDAQGRPLPPGTYFFEVRWGEAQFNVGKLALELEG